MTEHPILARAREIAEDILFPRALETDRSDAVPRANLDALASAGLYGVVGPQESGGAGAGSGTFLEVVELLAGGCLSTAFVWSQHHGVLRSTASSTTPGMRERVGPLCRGELRGGIALAGLLSGPARIRARRDGSSWILNGTAPWVTGWGLIDVLQVAGRDERDDVVFGLIEAKEGAAVRVDPPLELVALGSAVTSTVHFTDLVIPADGVIAVQPLAERQRQDHLTLRTHSAMALGVAARCVRMLGETPLAAELAAIRRRVLAAAPEEMVEVKAAASEIAHRAAGALVVATGSRSLLSQEHAQRLAREALFMLVFGARPAITSALLRLLSRA